MAVAAQVEDDGLALAALLQASASRMATRIAWDGSGAGRMPSARVKLSAASKMAFCWHVDRLDQAGFLQAR